MFVSPYDGVDVIVWSNFQAESDILALVDGHLFLVGEKRQRSNWSVVRGVRSGATFCRLRSVTWKLSRWQFSFVIRTGYQNISRLTTKNSKFWRLPFLVVYPGSTIRNNDNITDAKVRCLVTPLGFHRARSLKRRLWVLLSFPYAMK